MKENNEVKVWCNKVANLATDELLDCQLIKKDDFEKVESVIAEEVFVRLTMGDYPPSSKDSETQNINRSE